MCSIVPSKSPLCRILGFHFSAYFPTSQNSALQCPAASTSQIFNLNFLKSASQQGSVLVLLSLRVVGLIFSISLLFSLQPALPDVQSLKTIVLYILSSFQFVYGRRSRPILVTSTFLEIEDPYCISLFGVIQLDSLISSRVKHYTEDTKH